MTDHKNEDSNATVVSLVRLEGERLAVIEYKTSQGTFYGLQRLYRSKEIAIQQARKFLSAWKK